MHCFLAWKYRYLVTNAFRDHLDVLNTMLSMCSGNYAIPPPYHIWQLRQIRSTRYGDES